MAETINSSMDDASLAECHAKAMNSELELDKEKETAALGHTKEKDDDTLFKHHLEQPDSDSNLNRTGDNQQVNPVPEDGLKVDKQDALHNTAQNQHKEGNEISTHPRETMENDEDEMNEEDVEEDGYGDGNNENDETLKDAESRESVEENKKMDTIHRLEAESQTTEQNVGKNDECLKNLQEELKTHKTNESQLNEKILELKAQIEELVTNSSTQNQKLVDAENENKEMKSSLDALQKCIEDHEVNTELKNELESQVEDLTSKNTNLQEKLSALEGQMTDMHSKFHSMETAVDEFRQAKEKIACEFENYQATTNLEKGKLQEKADQLSSNEKELKIKSEQLTTELEKCHLDYNEKVQGLTREKVELNSNLEKTKTENKNLTDQVEQLNTKVSQLGDSLAESGKNLLSQKETSQKQINQLSLEVDFIQKSLSDAEENLEELRKESHAYEETTMQYAREKEGISKAFAEFQKSTENETEMLHTKIKQLEEQCQLLSNNLQKSGLEKEELKTRLVIEMEEIKAAQEVREKMLDETKSQKGILEQTLAQLKDEQENQEKEHSSKLTELQNEKTTLENQMQTFENEKQTFIAEMRNLEEQNRILENDKRTLEENYASLHDILDTERSEKLTLQNSLFEVNQNVQSLQDKWEESEKALKSTNLEKDEINSCLEKLREEVGSQGKELQAKISDLETSVLVAETNLSQMKELHQENIDTHVSEKDDLQRDLTKAEMQIIELKKEQSAVESKFVEVMTQREELKIFVDDLKNQLERKDEEIRRKVAELENAVWVAESKLLQENQNLGDIRSEKEKLQQSLIDMENRVSWLKREYKICEKKFMDSNNQKEEIILAFNDYKTTSEHHKSQLQERISELESSIRITESNLVKQNEGLKKDLENLRYKETQMIKALAETELKLRQLQQHSKAARDIEKSSSRPHTRTTLSSSLRKDSTLKTDDSSFLRRSDSAKKTTLEHSRSKSKTRPQSTTSKRLESSILGKKPETTSTIRKTESSKKLEVQKKLDPARKYEPLKKITVESSSHKRLTSPSAPKQRAPTTYSMFSDNSISDLETLDAKPKSSSGVVKKTIVPTTSSIKSTDKDKEKEDMKSFRRKFFSSGKK